MGLTALVVDASAGVELLLGTPEGESLADQMPREHGVWVPEHYFVEVAGALRRIERRRQFHAIRANMLLEQLIVSLVLPVRIHALLRQAWARRGHLTVADALYVVLAEELGATLVTTDKRLAKSPQMRVPTITP